MRHSITLIDKARSLCSPATDYQLAKTLGLKHSTISRCRHKGGTLDNEACLKLATLLGQNALDVIAVMEAERAKTPEKKQFWESRLPRILPVVAILGITTGLTPSTSEATVASARALTTLPAIHYAQWRLAFRRVVTRILDGFAAMKTLAACTTRSLQPC